ncbi:MAG: acetolactate synthase [Verrucomicrobiota bacterium]
MEEEAEATILGERVVQYSVFVQNRVGALLSIVRLLKEASVDVLGLSVHDSVDVTIVRIVVSDPDTVGTLFIEKGIPYGTVELTVVELPEGSAGLASCLAALLQAELNVNFAYPMLTRPEGKALLAFSVDDPEVAASVLLKCGFRLINQQDLSR